MISMKENEVMKGGKQEGEDRKHEGREDPAVIKRKHGLLLNLIFALM